MKVLLIAYSFPPAAGVGVLRAVSLAKYLPENGVEVHVLTARNAAAVGQDSRPLSTLSPAVSIHRTWTADLPFSVRKRLKKLVSGSGRNQASKSLQARTQTGAAKRKGSIIKRFLADLLLPDPQIGWIPFAIRAARRIIHSEKIDVVLITVPPFSALRLAKKLRRKHKELPVILDFRDEWLTSTLHLVSFNQNRRAVRIAQQTESEAIAASTGVVCATEAAVKELRARYPGEQGQKFQCIPNGFDVVLPTEADVRNRIRDSSESKQIVLTYLGSVYGSTDPRTVVDAITHLDSPIRERILLRFVGHIEDEQYRDALLGLGRQIELVGFLPQAEALKYINSTTYLLLITHDRINVSAKLYDYLGSGVPILAAVDPKGDAFQIVTNTRAGWCADVCDPVALSRLFEEAVERAAVLKTEFKPDLAQVAEFQRSRLAQRYASILKSAAR